MMKRHVQAGWNEWSKVSCVMHDRGVSARIKGKVYKMMVVLMMLFGLETFLPLNQQGLRQNPLPLMITSRSTCMGPLIPIHTDQTPQ